MLLLINSNYNSDVSSMISHEPNTTRTKEGYNFSAENGTRLLTETERNLTQMILFTEVEVGQLEIEFTERE